jgi:hypothetical protein
MRKIFYTILIIAVIVFAIQLVLMLRDRKKNKANPAQFSVLKLIPFALTIIGIFMYGVSWVSSPISNSLSFFELITNFDPNIDSNFKEDLLIIGFLIFCCLGFMTSATFFQLIFRIKLKSIATLIFEVLIGLGCSVLGLIVIYKIKHMFDNAFSNELEQFFAKIINISAGYGIIIIVLIGFLYAGFVITMQLIAQKKLKRNPMVLSDFDNLRELNKLLAEGIITQEDFDRKKNQILD